ncbi:MAG: chloride channel protein [Sedimenticolaceae bacterium]
MKLQRLRKFSATWSERLDESRIHLARPDALLPLAFLGLLTGLLAGGVIVLFRLFVEGIQDAILPGSGPENYEALSGWGRLLLPLLAAVLLAAMFRWVAQGITLLGVASVMERMAYHQGRFTLRGFLLQFFGAAFAIIGGHSVGREAPHVFLGASSGSLLAQHLGLPNNVIRALVGCGAAAGIAASFNTPLAGVVFALEVVMMEYTVASFIPVILAAVSATTLSNFVFGDAPAFTVPAMHIGALHELALVLVLGVVAGGVSAAFIHAVQTVASHARPLPIWWRMLLAGVLAGGFGWLLPELMGIGYDSVELALNGGFALTLLLALLVGKLLATAVCIGLGVPGGMIGPSLFIGAMLGALMAKVALLVPLELASPVGFYALLGMGAMMSGSLQAPLAALTAMLELTDNPDIILPGMLAVVVAGLTASALFGKDSLFLTMLRASGLDYATNPVLQTLRRVGVASVMNRSVVRVANVLDAAEAERILGGQPDYLLIDHESSNQVLMPTAELAKFLQSSFHRPKTAAIDLMAIPAQRLEVAQIELQASLQEARALFEERAAEALVVQRMTAPGIRRVYGIITPDMVEKSYR